jgi:hypothetical protein
MTQAGIRAIIDKYAARPFGYGGVDCCQFVGECIEVFTGDNPATGFLYADEAGALAHIERYGSLEALVTAKLGEPYDERTVRVDIKNGDVVVFDQADGSQIAGVVYQGRGVVRTETGLTDWPLEGARAVWPI